MADFGLSRETVDDEYDVKKVSVTLSLQTMFNNGSKVHFPAWWSIVLIWTVFTLAVCNGACNCPLFLLCFYIPKQLVSIKY